MYKRQAYAAADGVAKFPGQFNNPLFIYGGVGLGKTHLMHAIGNQILNNFPEYEIMYVTCETFTNDLIESLQRNSMSQFRNKYRKVDVLLIDDIQFLANKDSTQEEFFHTFNTLYEAGKQIVISSDKPSTEIPRLAERLLSRFRMRMSADIHLPDFETRVAILRNKTPFLMEQTGCSIPMSDEVFFYIANKSNTNIRDLEGALRKVIAYAKLNSLEKPLDEIGVDIATEAVSYTHLDRPPSAMESIRRRSASSLCSRSNARAWRSVRPFVTILFFTARGNRRIRNLLAIVDWFLDNFLASSSCVKPCSRIKD